MALSDTAPLPFPQSEGNNSVFQPPADDLEVLFAEHFTRLQGKFVYCADHRELGLQLKGLIGQMQWKEVFCREKGWLEIMQEWQITPSKRTLPECDVAITGCELLVARTGSIMMSAAQESGRTTSVYAPVHICIAYTRQLVYDVKDALQFVKEKYGNRLPGLVTFATGPSRTADIEKTLVVGVHGPKDVFVFLVENEG